MTDKDDVARLLHLYKWPAAQALWSTLSRPLDRQELDARNSEGALADAANAWECLAERFNDYKMFNPQHAMLKYVDVNGKPLRKEPHAANSERWTTLVPYCHFVEPTNLAKTGIVSRKCPIDQ